MKSALGILVTVWLSAGCAEPSREITADTFHVLRVIDGDTFVIRYDGEPTSVRLWGIDAPELSDPGGPAAAAELRRLIDDRRVRLVLPGPRKRDNFGRLLARVYVDGADHAGPVEVSQAMLAADMARPHRKALGPPGAATVRSGEPRWPSGSADEP